MLPLWNALAWANQSVLLWSQQSRATLFAEQIVWVPEQVWCDLDLVVLSLEPSSAGMPIWRCDTPPLAHCPNTSSSLLL